jgi:hypothetical protein
VDTPTQDYADAQVPDGATVNGLQIALIISGIGATLPMFTPGTQIASAQGLRRAAVIALLACAMVGVLAETYSGHSLSGIPAVDSILLTAMGHIVMNVRARRLPEVST